MRRLFVSVLFVALALLAYNRGAQKTTRELKLLLNEQNKQCSICALTADRSKRDEAFGSDRKSVV